jgi:hypothetical protein
VHRQLRLADTRRAGEGNQRDVAPDGIRRADQILDPRDELGPADEVDDLGG